MIATGACVMLRRVNVWGASVACGLCLLLLLAGSRYTSNFRPASTRHINTLLGLTLDDDNPVAEPTQTRDYILERTRAKIRMLFANSTRKLQDLTLELGGKPLRSIIVSTWRSGTTFLGEVLGVAPGTFYHYEPLLSYDIIQIRGPPHADAALTLLSKMLHCDFSDMEEYFEFGRTHKHQFSHNTWLWEYCRYDSDLCVDSNFMSRFCRLFPHQTMKLVRLRLRLLHHLLDDELLNVKVVLLVRDPRAVMQSRQHRDWCPPSPDCWRSTLLCGDMVSDYSAAVRLLKTHPHRFTVVRYEDLALSLDAHAHALLDFLELGSHADLDRFLQTHSTLEVGGVSSTFRRTRDMPFRWKTQLSFDMITHIQDRCGEAMRLWGYRAAHNLTHLLSSDFLPLHTYTVE